MASTRRGGRARLTIGLLVLTAVALLTLDGRGSGPVQSARSAVMSVLSPIGNAVSAVLDPVADAWNGAFSNNDFQKRNEDLQLENDRLQGEVISNSIAKAQLQQLLELVGIPFVGDTPRVHARVSYSGVGNFGETIELDKGSSSGIERNMPVITGKGLIGKVVEVSDNRCVISLITSGNFKIGFSVVGTPAVGIAQGTGSDGVLRGANLDARQAVSVGQIVVTSGLSGSPYPPNIPIGTIIALRTDPAALESTVDIRMLASTSDLTYVDVLLWKPVS